jgi:hypothetical protein
LELLSEDVPTKATSSILSVQEVQT